MSKKSRNSDASAAIDRPFDPDILRQAREIAEQYQVVLSVEDGDYIGCGVELPQSFEDGKTPDECVAKARDMFTTVVATMLERDEVPPPPASEGKRTEQVNVRLSALEKRVLESAARRRGFVGLGDYLRSTALNQS